MTGGGRRSGLVFLDGFVEACERDACGTLGRALLRAGLWARGAVGSGDEAAGALEGAAFVVGEGVQAFLADFVEDGIDFFLHDIDGGIACGIALAGGFVVDFEVDGEAASFGGDEFELGARRPG